MANAYSGGYNIGASTRHASGTRWRLDTLMHSSVRGHAPDDDVSERLTAADIAARAAEYKTILQYCHGGPGAEPAAWSRRMLPRPTHLQEEAAKWEAADVFPIVRHGLKYTGMPSFERRHDQATLWSVGALVKLLPAMTPEQYAPPKRKAMSTGTAVATRCRPRGDHDH